jgi:hypothetical protein
MTLSDLRTSLSGSDPPAGLSHELLALWHDARGDWARAHATVQDLSTPAAAWIHAYLHRKEGDQGNARYWYQHAGQPVYTGTLDAEWDHIAGALMPGA